jgi:hypothetical protein
MMQYFAKAAALGVASLQLCFAPAAAGGAAPSDVVLAPHRAVYNLSLDNTSAGSGVADVTGRIVYELTGSACEGYAQSMRYVTQSTNQEGVTQVTDLRTSSWEAVPARRLRFSTVNYQNDQPSDQTQGSAQRDRSTGPVKVELTRPAKRGFELANDIYFPVQHSMTLIRRAREGAKLVTADLYDGSESGDKVYNTSTIIGRQIVPGAKSMPVKLKDADKLDQVPSWPVSIGYYPVGPVRGDVLPLYEMSYRFHDNGVTSSLRIDHGEFAIRGDLEELVYLEAGKCPPAKP